ncbi:MAG TPA: hypothetical protein VEL78_06390, partial [Pyrinomonadaceae bacterium]|nr:hypothetical protein [Pyrinomonadaceae bacterium]
MTSMHQNTESNNWYAENQRALMAELAFIRKMLEHHTEAYAAPANASLPDGSPRTNSRSGRTKNGKEKGKPLPQPVSGLGSPSPEQSALLALDQLCVIFGLTQFERTLLLLCAGIELDSRFAPLCAAAQGDASRTHPTFSLALSALPEPHWSALRPTGPLRHWRLIEVGTGDSLTTSSLRIDERTLHFLTGVACVDERLLGLVRALAAPMALPRSQYQVAERLAELWQQSGNTLVQLCGNDPAGAQTVAAAACAALQIQVFVLGAEDLPVAAAERDALVRLWEREAILSNSALLVACDESSASERLRPLTAFLETIQGPVVAVSRDP